MTQNERDKRFDNCINLNNLLIPDNTDHNDNRKENRKNGPVSEPPNTNDDKINKNGGDKDGGKYNPDSIFMLQIMYIIAIILWIIIILIFKLYEIDIIGWILLAIPFIVFIISFISLSGVDDEVEKFMLDGNFLYFGYIIILLIITWGGPIKDSKLINLIGLGIIFLMISIMDIWVPKDVLDCVKHLESIVETLAAVIFIYILYYYYYYHYGKETEKNKTDKK